MAEDDAGFFFLLFLNGHEEETQSEAGGVGGVHLLSLLFCLFWPVTMGARDERCLATKLGFIISR